MESSTSPTRPARGGKWNKRQPLATSGDLQKLLYTSVSPVPVELIDVDPNQPRSKLRNAGITPETIRQHLANEIDLLDPSIPDRASLFEELQGLAGTIKKYKLIHPIRLNSVNIDGIKRYVIDVGERRYLSHILLQEKSIDAIVDGNSRDETVRTKKGRQLVENLHQKKLAPDEMAFTVKIMDQEYLEFEKRELPVAELSVDLGVSERQARTYLAVARAPTDVFNAVTSGMIVNLQAAEELSIKVSNKKDREWCLGRLKASEVQSLKAVKQIIKDLASLKEAGTKKPGRPSTHVTLGKVENTKIISTLMQSYLGAEKFKKQYRDIDWSDHKAVASVWGLFLKVLIKEVK